MEMNNEDLNQKHIPTENKDIQDSNSNEFKPKTERGKKLYFVLDLKAYESLKTECKNKSLSMTKFLEKIILEKSQDSQERISKIFSLTKLNKELYDGTNATYSNINQIAYCINTFKILNDGKIDDLLKLDFLEKILESFNTLNNDIQNLRILILELLLILENNGIENRKIRNKLKKFEYKLSKNKPIDIKFHNEIDLQAQKQKNFHSGNIHV
ncbi:hypothetical protein [Helicobacter sp. 11S03491-1]|uniref:hypothetical protein n=1 Tax=Helicobacter sp. 11S03491-1 TaxID=1476196 RepID=UPI000BA52689|nr:hypothetical protein [Helicobacter sp. 11S03491-1]PAF42168.1 hypothetical protein BKH45_04265 [Helicobacter sp. 11S03491-1]